MNLNKIGIKIEIIDTPKGSKNYSPSLKQIKFGIRMKIEIRIKLNKIKI